MSESRCYMCDGITDPDYICTQCDELVCEECMVKMTIHNQIDYCLCEGCHSDNEISRADHYQSKERQKEIDDKIKKDKAHKRWIKYHSPTQIEKRRLKRIELLKWRKEQAAKRVTEMAKVLHDIFKHM